MIDYSVQVVTPEQEAAFRARFLQKEECRLWPIEVQQTPEGFIASRDGLSGRGATRDEAIERFHNVERRWVVDPTGFLDDLLEGKIDPNTLKPI